MVHNSKFISNRATQNVVYIDASTSSIPGHVSLQDNVFVNNTGVPVYISHSNLHLRGSMLFKDNKGNLVDEFVAIIPLSCFMSTLM